MSETNMEKKFHRPAENEEPKTTAELPQETQEINKPPAEFAKETEEQMEQEANMLVEQGQAEIARLDKSSALPEEQLSEVKKEVGVDNSMKSFGERAKDMLMRAKENLRKFFSLNPEGDESSGETKTEELVAREPEPMVRESHVNAPVSDLDRLQRLLNNKKDNKEIFNPEQELAEIRKLPRAERKQALEDFKERLAEQKSELAKLQSRMMLEIQVNPDMSKEQMMNMIKKFGESAEMNEKQLEVAEALVDAYQAEHERVKELHEQYPQAEELFKALYGKYPEGDVEVEECPSTFLFKIYDDNDFAFLTTSAQRQRSIAIEDITDDEKKYAAGASGVNLRWNLDPLLRSVIVMKMSADESRHGEIVKHEEQHALNDLFNDTVIVSNAKADLLASTTDNEREAAMHRYFTDKRRVQGEILVKDEIMAYYTGDPTFTPKNISNILLRPEGLYNYFKDAKENLAAHLAKDLIPKMGEEKFKEMTERVFQEVYVDEYKKVVEDGAQAFADLFKKGKFTVKDAVGLLSHEPLSKWKMVVNRILEQPRMRKLGSTMSAKPTEPLNLP